MAYDEDISSTTNDPYKNLNETHKTSSGSSGSGSLSGGSSSGSSSSSSGRSFKDMSPEEVRDMMRQKVAKGVAAVAGALQGFNDESKKDNLPEETRKAIQTAGETTRTAASTSKDEFHKTAEKTSEFAKSAKQDVRKLGESARDIGSTAKEEMTRTRDTVKGGGASGGMQGAGLSNTSDYNKGLSSSGMGSSTSATGLGPEPEPIGYAGKSTTIISGNLEDEDEGRSS